MPAKGEGPAIRVVMGLVAGIRSKAPKQFWTCLRQVLLLGVSMLAVGCSMSEEVKRIERLKLVEQRQAEQNSTNLTGEQIFIRSCNTCHPGGRKGMGPALDKLGQHFPDDRALKSFIRAGRGLMPAQSPQALSDQELDNLLSYLRSMS